VPPVDHPAELRAFNRFYTGALGLLDAGHLASPFTLTEARVLFELAQRETTETLALRTDLALDAGHLSRILARFEGDGLLRRRRAAADARRQVVSLTARGRRAFAALDERATAQAAELLGPLPAPARGRLVTAMRTIREVLDAGAPTPAACVLRPPRAGELGWIVARHGELYCAEHGWDESFEALVARIVAEYAERHDPRREAAWIAELESAPAGCVLCVATDDPRTAKLRALLVDDWARGRGVGGRLVEQCLTFARGAGYEAIELWTNDVLADARRIYERAGFELVAEEPHHSFGADLVGQTWRRSLGP
jgi:DNA-binding MarR family transcriptional regulator/N-acetylglutamate synthase-like GNAT family acetyltransferase